jgi:predicted AlkP superfamily phosphohydrolase/phosphomutase
MPHLQSILGAGASAGLLSTPHPLTPPAWTTVMTGRTPGNHGIFDFLRPDFRPEGAFFTLTNFRDIRCETLWSIVSRQGGRASVVNYPITAPPPAINGVVIPGTLSWRHLRRHVYPAGLYEELKALPGFNAKELSWDFEHEKAHASLSDEEFEPWIRFHTVRERGWFNVLRHLMRAHPADLTAVVFDGVDKLQHGCWRFLDPELFPVNPTALEQHLRQACLEYFRHLDAFLGEIQAGCGNARVFIMSDHGFGPSTRLFRVNKWLEQHGYLAWQSSPQGSAAGRRWDSHLVQFDWTRTIAYAPSVAANGIYIRVKQGPGDTGIESGDYLAFRARLMDELRRIPDPHRPGAPLLADVLTREQAFPGVHPERAPDLTLVLCDHGFISIGNAEPAVAPRPQPMGTHYPEGILIACGPGLRRGVTISRQSILDMGPTLLYSLGLPIPLDFEGRVITDLFEPEFLRSRPPQLGAATEPVASTAKASSGMDAGDEATILDRLRSLGYVE